MCIFPDTADILRGRCTESDRAERDDGCEDYLWSDAVSQLQKCTIHVNDEILNRYDPEMSREEAEDTAVALCLDIAEALRGAADGFYLMTPFHRVGLVNRIINAIKQGE